MIRSGPHRETALLDLRVLDGFRGALALYVVLFHAWGLLWHGGLHQASSLLPAGGAPGALIKIASYLQYGHQAVLGFFLISGFCIHYRQAQAFTAQGSGSVFDLRSFAARRLKRLYPPLIFAIVLTALLDLVGRSLFPDFYALGASAQSVTGWVKVPPTHEWSVLLGNLLFQGGLGVPHFGTDGPLWSLSFEAWFYVGYPVVLALRRRVSPSASLALVGIISLIAGSAYAASPTWIARLLSYWFVWIAGAVVADAYVRRSRSAWLPFGGPLALVALHFSSLIGIPWGHPPTDLLWGTLLSLVFAFVVLGLPGRAQRRLEHAMGPLTPLGTISYSLYLNHFPLFVLIAAWWLSSHTTLPIGIELAVPGVAAALVTGAVSWWLAERPFQSRRSHSITPAGVVAFSLRTHDHLAVTSESHAQDHSPSRRLGARGDVAHGSSPGVERPRSVRLAGY
jgi:peptidoglycan/LPS O-acetylase OafA/YrhL